MGGAETLSRECMCSLALIVSVRISTGSRTDRRRASRPACLLKISCFGNVRVRSFSTSCNTERAHARTHGQTRLQPFPRHRRHRSLPVPRVSNALCCMVVLGLGSAACSPMVCTDLHGLGGLEFVGRGPATVALTVALRPVQTRTVRGEDPSAVHTRTQRHADTRTQRHQEVRGHDWLLTFEQAQPTGRGQRH